MEIEEEYGTDAWSNPLLWGIVTEYSLLLLSREDIVLVGLYLMFKYFFFFF